MSEDSRFDRREFLRAGGVVAAGAAFAGCTDSGGGGGGGGGGGEEQEPAGGAGENETGGNETGGNETEGANETDNETEGGNETDNETAGNESAAGGGEAEEVIAGPNGELVFDPEEVTISPGTTVRWVWESDTHNVVPTEQPEESNWEGHPDIENAGYEYEHTFETPGTYEYVCEPHESAGMVGSITVEE